MSKLSPLLSALCEIVATQNWMFVLILVPVSLSYDLFDYGKYKTNLILKHCLRAYRDKKIKIA